MVVQACLCSRLCFRLCVCLCVCARVLVQGKYPCSLDFSPAHFILDSDQFMTACRDIVKE